MRKNIILSIILPVYGVEKYIELCLKSILPQIKNNSRVELIIVNDCTLDSSMEIAYKISKDYSNVVFVEREKNGGLSDARNSGINVASGQYCWFVDSDDSIDLDSIKKIVDRVSNEQPDLLIFNHNRIDELCNVIYRSCLEDKKMINFFHEKKLIFIADYIQNKVGFEVWNKIYKTEIIKINKIFFEKNKEVFAEDICFNLMYLTYCVKVDIIIDYLYNYLIRGDSIMGTKNVSKLKEMENLCECLFTKYKGFYSEYIGMIYSSVMQIEYNANDFTQIDEYISKDSNSTFAVNMNKLTRKNIINYRKYLSKKNVIKSYLYATYYLLINDNKNGIMIKKMIDILK
ncbi:glycosyltransferase, group 2 family protein [Turicibacter sp. HGF1]|uniref:glycosyltransferase n=1 Tax=Turicibacter sp. HGF1 TaxID=910310 RepID=UPI0001FDB400|nr:glycosyltransferase [Turicibacter sp. HGF1]EGC90837.1 glycosyltransferase, group 2 family protein [Turicibacter sp. HGF1]